MAGTELHDNALGGVEAMQIDEPESDGALKYTPLQLSEKETQILELYDRLEEVQLEIGFLEAQEMVLNEPSEAVSEKDLEVASEMLLEAKARYALRNTIVESIMMANPVLKAVHAGLNATPIERDLRPLVEERDNLSISLTEISARILSTMEKLTKVEAEHVRVARKNADLATKMIALAEEADTQKEDVKDPNVRAQLDELEEDLKIVRQRWRIMKGTASAVVSGSGVDWSRDPALRELVLDMDGD